MRAWRGARTASNGTATPGVGDPVPYAVRAFQANDLLNPEAGRIGLRESTDFNNAPSLTAAPSAHTEEEMSIAVADGTSIRFGLVGFLSGAALLALGAFAHADSVRYTAELTGRGEVPPNDSPATGHCEATLDTGSLALSWSCQYTGLTAAPIGAHFHGPVSYIGATSEENAPIQVGTPGNLASPFKGTATIDAHQAADLKIGRWDFNLHSKNFPAGEIRGPVVHQ